MRRAQPVRLLEVGALACIFAAVVGTAVRAVAAPDPAEEGADPAEEWPLAYLQRPITLREGMLAIGVGASVVVPDHRENVDPTNGLPFEFFPYAEVGPSFDLGVTDWLELDLFVPRLLCADSGNQPSGCSDYLRLSGSGAAATYAFLRAPGVQGAASVGVESDRTSPFELEWRAVAALKLVPWDVFGIWLDGSLRRDINPPATQTMRVTTASINLGLDVQVNQRTLLWLNINPWAPLGYLGEGIALELSGGFSYAIDHHTELALDAGSYNVRANPAWNGDVPEWFASLSFVYWCY